MNRNKAPKTKKYITPGNIRPEILRLKNGIPLYMIQAGSQPVIRLDVTLKAGSWWQSKPLTASTAVAMVSEGTARRSGEQIAGTLDYHGAYLNSSSDRDNAFLTVYFLTKHTDTILPLVADMIREPVFPGDELISYKERRKQNYLIDIGKVGSLAREKFALALYGPGHPYGMTLTDRDFDNIEREDLKDFHSRHYNSKNCKIVVSGKYDESSLAARIEKLFGDEWGQPGNPGAQKIDKQPSGLKKMFVQKKDAVQSALRIGRETFTKSHPDYPGMLVLNNLLGGHFGSRLMQNIREKKGYTYGIGSALASFRNSGYIVIVSEVGTGYHKATLKEIYRELDKLCSRPVSKRELELARSQMMGDFLRDFDGPFARAGSIRNIIEHELETDYFDKIISTIINITPAELRELACKYLSPDTMYEVVAGDT